MIINDDHNFIFVHVYRTGGSSMDKGFPGVRERDTHRKLETVPRWKDYFSFGFVRNPWDRTVSSYMYAKARNKISGTFEQYVQSFVGQETKKFAQYVMVQNCSFIGRFEQLQDEVNRICKHVTLPPFTLPHVWKTDHKPYQEYYNDELIEIVREHQQGDIEHFGFSFDSTSTTNTGWVK